MSLTKSLPACLALSFASFATYAADGPPPSVNEPSGINLGGTSFYDGFAGPPGLSHLTYLKFSTAHSIKDNAGKDNGAFDNPKINIITLINQLSYYSPNSIGGGAHLGWSLLVPIVSLDGDFGDNGPKLQDNGTGLGDIVVGLQIQFDPIVNTHGRPVFVQRLAFDTILPTGKYDKHQIVHSDRLMKWKEFMSDHLGRTPDYIKRLESTFIDPLHNSNFQGRLEYGDLGQLRFC